MNSTAEINTAVHPDDEMMAVMQTAGQGVNAYIESGKKNTQIFFGIVERYKPHLLEDKWILDHGCGYGRMTRHYSNIFSTNNVVAADVTGAMVEFCAEQFNALPFLISKQSPISHLDHKVDVIISVSVFSHLPPNSFKSTMQELRELLNPDGILMFTTAGEYMAEIQGVKLGEEGYWYGAIGNNINETKGRLDEEEYGCMRVRSGYVTKILEESGLKLLEFIPRGHVGRQDVFVVEPVEIPPAKSSEPTINFLDKFINFFSKKS